MKNYKKLISAKPVLLAAIALIAIIVPMSASAANDAIVLSSGNAYVGNGPEGIAIAASYDESGKLTYIRTKHVDKDCVARFDVEKKRQGYVLDLNRKCKTACRCRYRNGR